MLSLFTTVYVRINQLLKLEKDLNWTESSKMVE